MAREHPIQAFCDQRRVCVLSDAPLNAGILDVWRKTPPTVRDGLIVVPAEEHLATGQFLAGITAAEVRHAVDALTALQKRLPAADSHAAVTQAFFASLSSSVQERMLQASFSGISDGGFDSKHTRARLQAAREDGINYRDLNAEQRQRLETMFLAASAGSFFPALPLWKRIQRAVDRGELRLSTTSRSYHRIQNHQEYKGTATYDVVHIDGDERLLQAEASGSSITRTETGRVVIRSQTRPRPYPLLVAPIDRWESLELRSGSLEPGIPRSPDPPMRQPKLSPLDVCPDLKLKARLADLCAAHGISLPTHLRERRITLYTPAGAPPPRAAVRAALNLFDLHLEGPPGTAFAIRNRPAGLSAKTILDAVHATLPTPVLRTGRALSKATKEDDLRAELGRNALSRALLLRCAAERKSLMKGGETRRFDEASADFQDAILTYLFVASFPSAIDAALVGDTIYDYLGELRIRLDQRQTTPEGDIFYFGLDRIGDY